MEILRDDVICEWKRLFGFVNFGVVRIDVFGSVRVFFGIDGIRNVVYGFDFFVCVVRVRCFKNILILF